VAAYADREAIVDESAARAAITEVTAEWLTDVAVTTILADHGRG